MYENILQAYKSHRNPVQAEPMARYMKERFPFLGLTRPERNAIQADFIKKTRRQTNINWDFVQQCWAQPEREYQYLALDYLVALVSRLQSRDLERLETLIRAKSWWDTVDIIAVRLVGEIGRGFPTAVQQTALDWAQSEDIWRIRSAILFQLKYKQATNTDLLARIILNNRGSSEFFVAKAIGWALREYSKTNPVWVRTFIAAHSLPALSVREGSKYL
ncbi:MAG: DNA alkylation repair protein [Syntrophomonas sp.]|nr:DNA alkylation repair protein [Syntrophomonas sp.]